MFRHTLLVTVLTMTLISCSGYVFEEDVGAEPPADKKPHCHTLQTVFRFTRGARMFSDFNGIPYQYHVPRIDMKLEDLGNGFIKALRHVKTPRRGHSACQTSQISAPSKNEPTVPNEPDGNRTVSPINRFSWRLAATTRKLTALESINAHLWQRDPVPLNRLMMSLESPTFLGNFFYALTSLTEVNGTTVLSRFYYAPVFTARYGYKQKNYSDMILREMKLNVFSMCIEPSDASEDASTPLLQRPQRIIDAGLRSSHSNLIYDVETKLRENATDKLNTAENHLEKEDWDKLFSNPTVMTYRWPPKHASPYDTIKTLFGEYFKDHLTTGSPTQTAFHRYDLSNEAYIFAYGPGDQNTFYYGLDGSKLLIFINPKTHFGDETKLWDMCVDLWREEMRSRYGTVENSRLIHPHAYLSEKASTAPYYKMLPRYEALGTPQEKDMVPLRRVSQPGNHSEPRMPQHRDKSEKPRKRTAKDMQREARLPGGFIEPVAVREEPGLPAKRYLPTSAVPVSSGSTNPRVCNTGEWTTRPFSATSEPGSSSSYLGSSASCSNDPNMLEASGLPNHRLYCYEHMDNRLVDFASLSNAGANTNWTRRAEEHGGADPVDATGFEGHM